jgi:replicative DNA helicase
MKDNEKLKAQFSRAASEAQTPQDILTALTELERADGLKIADYIAAFCREAGLDPQTPELADYYRESTEYKAKIQANEDKKRKETALKALGEKSEYYQKNLATGVPTTTPEMTELAAAIGKEAAILGAGQGEQSRLGSFTDYIRECVEYEPDQDFAPCLFDKLSFPNGTVSYIGARTGRGKTTAMVNLMREAITQEKPRKTLFVSLEMSRKQILNKLILATAYAMSAAQGQDKEYMNARPRPQTDLYHFLKGQDMEGEWPQVNAFRTYVKKAMDHVESVYNISLLIYDGRGSKFQDIISMIKGNADPGNLVLLDYIQRMPDVPEKSNDTYMRLKWISDEIINTAIETNSLVISGAQFNRMTGSNAGGRDKFDDASFRESGDIEQDAHNAIGIGWEADKLTRFFEVLKTREDAGAGKAFFIDFVGAYSYMTIGEKWTPRQKETKPKKDGKPEGETSGAFGSNDDFVITTDMVRSQERGKK